MCTVDLRVQEAGPVQPSGDSDLGQESPGDEDRNRSLSMDLHEPGTVVTSCSPTRRRQGADHEFKGSLGHRARLSQIKPKINLK